MEGTKRESEVRKEEVEKEKGKRNEEKEWMGKFKRR